MTSPVNEDERKERTIRNLRKLPENRRCINCNSLGPQYVCINFWTFICTTCSGIHREFNHRVKSVSFAKFTSQEVSALQEGGNACAKEIYLKEWETQHVASFPDPKSVIPYLNVRRLRYYIRDVYVDKRYIGPPSERPSPGGRSDDTTSKNSNEEAPPPPSTAQLPQLQHTTHLPAQTSTSLDNNWAKFDSVQEMKTSHAPSYTNFLDVLSECLHL